MNSDPPFNPLPLPDNLNLEAQPQATQPGSEPGTKAGKNQQQAKTKRKTNQPRRRSGKRSSSDESYRAKWERIKASLTAKLATIDQEKLKKVLLACGIAVGVVVAVLLAIKLMPVAVTLLALVGIALAIRVWDALRWYPRPF